MDPSDLPPWAGVIAHLHTFVATSVKDTAIRRHLAAIRRARAAGNVEAVEWLEASLADLQRLSALWAVRGYLSAPRRIERKLKTPQAQVAEAGREPRQ